MRYDFCDEDRDELAVLSDATKALTATSTTSTVEQMADDILFTAMEAVESLGRKHRAARPALARKMARHAVELRELVGVWRDEGQLRDKFARVRRR